MLGRLLLLAGLLASVAANTCPGISASPASSAMVGAGGSLTIKYDFGREPFLFSHCAPAPLQITASGQGNGTATAVITASTFVGLATVSLNVTFTQRPGCTATLTYRIFVEPPSHGAAKVGPSCSQTLDVSVEPVGQPATPIIHVSALVTDCPMSTPKLIGGRCYQQLCSDSPCGNSGATCTDDGVSYTCHCTSFGAAYGFNSATKTCTPRRSCADYKGSPSGAYSVLLAGSVVTVTCYMPSPTEAWTRFAQCGPGSSGNYMVFLSNAQINELASLGPNVLVHQADNFNKWARFSTSSSLALSPPKTLNMVSGSWTVNLVGTPTHCGSTPEFLTSGVYLASCNHNGLHFQNTVCNWDSSANPGNLQLLAFVGP